jgi:hypothetical protein
MGSSSNSPSPPTFELFDLDSLSLSFSLTHTHTISLWLVVHLVITWSIGEGDSADLMDEGCGWIHCVQHGTSRAEGTHTARDAVHSIGCDGADETAWDGSGREECGGVGTIQHRRATHGSPAHEVRHSYSSSASLLALIPSSPFSFPSTS